MGLPLNFSKPILTFKKSVIFKEGHSRIWEVKDKLYRVFEHLCNLFPCKASSIVQF